MRLFGVLMGSLLASSSLFAQADKPAAGAAAPQEGKLFAVIETDKGNIRLELFASQVPMTVANFANLAQRGFFDGLKFHRVIADFMIQGGDPTGTGRGGPGYKFEDEIVSTLKHDSAGILSMANAGPATNGSQFFITHKATPHLDGKHTVFGKVVSGQETVNAISQNDVMKKVTIEGNTAPVFEKAKDKLAEWNKILDEKYPKKADK